MAKRTPQRPEQPGIALDSVAAHFQRQSAYFQQEALGLAAQVRELNQIVGRQSQQIASMMAPAAQLVEPKPSKGKKPAAA